MQKMSIISLMEPGRSLIRESSSESTVTAPGVTMTIGQTVNGKTMDKFTSRQLANQSNVELYLHFMAVKVQVHGTTLRTVMAY